MKNLSLISIGIISSTIFSASAQTSYKFDFSGKPEIGRAHV